MSAAKEKAPGVGARGNQKTYLTVADFRAFLNVTQAAREQAESELRLQAVDDMVRFVSLRMHQGLSLNQAAKWFLDVARARRMPAAHIEAALDALEELGWTPRGQKAAQ